MIRVVLSKIIIIFSKIFIILKLNGRIINQLNKLRAESHNSDNHRNIILRLIGKKKLIAMDVGAQGGFFNANIFPEKYNEFFDPIVIEPIPSEAEKLISQNYKVVPKGLWSTNCKKKLYVFAREGILFCLYYTNNGENV